jgi:hypothetical protein
MDRKFVEGERERTAQVVALLKARQLAVLWADHVTGTSLCPPGHAALWPRQAHLSVAQSHSGDVCNQIPDHTAGNRSFGISYSLAQKTILGVCGLPWTLS